MTPPLPDPVEPVPADDDEPTAVAAARAGTLDADVRLVPLTGDDGEGSEGDWEEDHLHLDCNTALEKIAEQAVLYARMEV